MVQAGDTGRDFEHCQELQRKLDDVDSVSEYFFSSLFFSIIIYLYYFCIIIQNCSKIQIKKFDFVLLGYESR